MSFLNRLPALARSVSGALCFSALAFFLIGKAHAITIDFDDLDPADFSGPGWYIPVTNEYESLGVLFDGYVNPVAVSTKSSPNFLHGSIGISIYFIDTLPTYVSMYVGSILEHKVGIRAHGADGYIEDRLTDGEVRGMQWEDSTPYRPNQFISFYIPEGISSINIDGQADSYIDDLTFSVSLPEPSAFILLWLGLLMVYLHRKRLQ
jgi:hypothetical protein